MEGVFELKQFKVFYNDKVFKITTDSLLLGSLANCFGANRILDIGTGTGIIALMLAQRFNNALVYAIDVSEEAFSLAQRNFMNSPWANRLLPVLGDVRNYDFKDLRFDCIVSNPPFYQNALLSAKQVDKIARHNITLEYDALAKVINKLLTDNGKAYIIIPYEVYEVVEQVFNFEYLFCRQKIYIYSVDTKSPKRVILYFGKGIEWCSEKNFYIKKGENFSQEYINLLKDFYINL